MLDQDVRGDARERVDERANRRRLLRGRLHRDERVKRADAGGFPAWNRGPIVGRDRGHGASPFRGLRLEGRLRAFDASRERLRAFLRRRRPRLRVGQSRLRRRRPRLRVGDSHLRRLRPRRRRVQRAFRRLETFRIRRFERARASRESSKRVAAGGFPARNRGPIVEYAAAGVGGGLVAKHQSRGAVAALAEVLVHDDVQRVAFGVVRGRKGGGGGRRRVPEDILEQAGGIAIDARRGSGRVPGGAGWVAGRGEASERIRALALDALEVLGRDAEVVLGHARAALERLVSSDERGNVRRLVRVFRERGGGEPRGVGEVGVERVARFGVARVGVVILARTGGGRGRARGIRAGSARPEKVVVQLERGEHVAAPEEVLGDRPRFHRGTRRGRCLPDRTVRPHRVAPNRRFGRARRTLRPARERAIVEDVAQSWRCPEFSPSVSAPDAEKCRAPLRRASLMHMTRVAKWID